MQEEEEKETPKQKTRSTLARKLSIMGGRSFYSIFISPFFISSIFLYYWKCRRDPNALAEARKSQMNKEGAPQGLLRRKSTMLRSALLTLSKAATDIEEVKPGH